MQELKKSLRDLCKDSTEHHGSLVSFVHDKGNAKLGDSLVNFLYSVAKSLVSKRTTGTKVSDSILTEAYKGSLWFKTKALELTGKKNRIADAIEALILFFWVKGERSLESLIDPLMAELEPERLHHPKEEHFSAVISFRSLLDSLYQSYTE